MSSIAHPFYPPVELPTHVETYAQGLADHRADYGDVPLNSPADLKGIVADATKLGPLADEIHSLQLTLAAKLDSYHKAASPLWGSFSEKLGHAKVHAEKNKKAALLNFLRTFQHHTKGHEAAKAAQKA